MTLPFLMYLAHFLKMGWPPLSFNAYFVIQTFMYACRRLGEFLGLSNPQL